MKTEGAISIGELRTLASKNEPFTLYVSFLHEGKLPIITVAANSEFNESTLTEVTVEKPFIITTPNCLEFKTTLASYAVPLLQIGGIDGSHLFTNFWLAYAHALRLEAERKKK